MASVRRGQGCRWAYRCHGQRQQPYGGHPVPTRLRTYAL